MNSYLGIKSNDESKDESNDVRSIGICGMSGTGKTTLAKVVFDKIHNKFDASSFLEDAREASKDTRGLEKLQDQLLNDMELKCNGDLRKKIQMISNGLHKKRVLIVVDDASKKEQLETLVGKPDWFGPRSRIIITTEDKHLLVSYKVQVGFSEEEAKIDLCKNFVNYAQGIPLVLKVLGSHLCTKSKKEWESTWNQLKAIPDEEITKKLQIAFDGLNTYERKLFLDIACFFKGEDRNHESEEPERRSRLWLYDDVLSVLKNNIPIEALQNTGPEPEPINLLLPNSFSGLSSLVSPDLSDCNLSDGALPDDLSCLYSIKSLNLSKNNFTSLPDSISELSELKLLLLDHCSELKSLPYLPIRFTFIDCLGLADDEGGKITKISLLDIHFKPLWQKFMEKQIHEIEGFYSVVPQTEIPFWFNHRSSESVDSVPIKLPDSVFNDKSWKGIAVCYFCSPNKFKRRSSWSGFESLSRIYLSIGHGWRS
uniref:ADP-ribosyl cyclase/cyclic ADP-ribose hydrolase n=1 Tax=Quercus lobata TaxID=97700 RepID=A0A7N2LDX6_QUELO